MKKLILINISILGFVFIIKMNFISLAQIQGKSMEPSFKDGDLVLLNIWTIKPKIGDVVWFKMNNSKTSLVKRVVASGEGEVYVEDFKVFQDKKLLESEAHYQVLWDKYLFYCGYSKKIQIKKDEYFLMGDNRCSSNDSRILGGINKSEIKGILLFKLPIFN